MENYNEMAFDCETERKLFDDLLNFLLDYNKKNDHYYNDIHIKQEENLILIQWNDVSYSGDFGPEAKFEFVRGDQIVMDEICLPDNTVSYVKPYDKYDFLNEWIEENKDFNKEDYRYLYM